MEDKKIFADFDQSGQFADFNQPVPEAEASESNVPEAEASESNVPEAEASESNVPEAEASESNVPEAETPEANVPEAETPEAGLAKGADESGQNSETETPKAGLAKGAAKTKKQRINAADLEDERQRAYARFAEDPNVSALAVATDLGIPKERVFKYRNDWMNENEKSMLLTQKEAMSTILRRIKFPSGDALASSTPLWIEFDDTYSVVKITPYSRA